MASNNLKDLFVKSMDIDEKSAKFLTRALANSNQPGFDYLEYKQSLRALEKLNMDESTAYQSAFATASTMGLTKAKLLETARYYMNILAREKKEFDTALQNQMKQRVSSREEEIKQLNAQIERLEEQIRINKKKVAEATGQIEQSQGKIETTKNNFERTFQVIAKEVEEDIERINSYL